MQWVIGITCFVSFVAALPIVHAITRFPLDVLGKLWGYAPNQFFFLLVPFPVAAFTTFVALSSILKKFQGERLRDPLLEWLIANWPVVILVGAIFASVITISDYFYTAKVFDRFEPSYAIKSLESADILRGEIEQSSANSDQIRQKIFEESEPKVQELLRGSALSRDEILALSPPIYMGIVSNAQAQRKWGLLNPIAHALSTLQLLAVLMTAFIGLFSISLSYLCARSGYQVSEFVNVQTFSILFFSIYPVCYRYFVSEIRLVTSSVSTIEGDIMASILIVIAAGIVLTVDPSRRDFINIFVRSLPFLLVIFPSIYLVVRGPLSLRSVIGIDTNPGLRITLFMVMILLASIVVFASWPREELID